MNGLAAGVAPSALGPTRPRPGRPRRSGARLRREVPALCQEAPLTTATDPQNYGLATAKLRILEAFVTSKLLKQQAWSEHDYQLFRFRDRDGAEVDLIIELDDASVIAIEVKASSTHRSEHFSGLRYRLDKLGERLTAGIVIGMSSTGYQYADRLYGLPAAALWQCA